MADPDPAERFQLADRFDRHARHVLLGVIPIALLAVSDLLTGWLLDDRRIDIALLVAAAIALWAAYSNRRMARRLRADDYAQGPPRWSSALSLVSFAAVLALFAGLGYLIGGWVPAVVIPSTTVVAMAAAIVLGIRRARRNATGH